MNQNWTPYRLVNFSSKTDQLHTDPLIGKLLLARGVDNQIKVDKFLKPDYERDLYDPYLLKGISVAVPRIVQAVRKNQKIVIFGDYDADGVPASVILAEFFRMIGFDNFSVYIPDRHKEAYGLSIKAVERFVKEEVELIITVDCGITAVDEVDYANKYNIDVIITDHHLVPSELPKALAIVNPKQRDCLYPDKMLAGAGVAFKLASALCRCPDFNISAGQEKWLLDLVAIATVSDMVPLVDENRALVYFGLKVLRKTRRLGLLRLFDLLKLKSSFLTEDDIGFMIGPRINSAGRMTHASEAYLLLMADNESEADKLAKNLEKQNKDRKRFVEEILSEVTARFEGKDLPSVVVCGEENWSIGVLGLAASRLSEKFKRVFFVWAKNGHGEIKGSCRSDGSVNLVELMKEAHGGDLFLDFGGHVEAGGFSILPGKLDLMIERLNQVYDFISNGVESEIITFDEELSLDDLSSDLFRRVGKLAPFGVGNPKPVFLFRQLVIEGVKSFGSEGTHLELIFKSSNGSLVKAIAFFSCQKAVQGEVEIHRFGKSILRPGIKINLLAHLEESYFGFKKEERLRIVDLEIVS